jgi:hypothetical protein
MNHRIVRRNGFVVAGLVAQLLAGAAQADATSVEHDRTLTLSPAEVDAAHLTLVALRAAGYAPEVRGLAVALAGDGLVQALSEAAAARAAARQSRSALTRSTQLTQGPGADSQSEHESAVKADADAQAVLRQALARYTSLLGADAPAAILDDASLASRLARGRSKLVRATFPLGVLQQPRPASLRLARIDAAPDEPGWRARLVWPGPADPAMPGRSVLTLIDADDLADGEHLLAWARVGTAAAQAGAVVPRAALLVSANASWCYVEVARGEYARRRLPTDRPTGDGYFVGGELEPGTRVVTAGAAFLLARQADDAG